MRRIVQPRESAIAFQHARRNEKSDRDVMAPHQRQHIGEFFPSIVKGQPHCPLRHRLPAMQKFDDVLR